MTVGLSSAQHMYLGMINQTLAARPGWKYLYPAIPLAIVHIESGDNPNAGPNGAGRFDGLGQVIPPTAAAMAALYGIPAGPQTDPIISIQSCIAYIDDSARSIIKFRNTLSLSAWDLMTAYNEGFGAVEQGRLDPAYTAKSQAELPIIESQMAGTASAGPASLTQRERNSFVPSRSRLVMPPQHSVGHDSETGVYVLVLLQKGLMPLTAKT